MSFSPCSKSKTWPPPSLELSDRQCCHEARAWSAIANKSLGSFLEGVSPSLILQQDFHHQFTAASELPSRAIPKEMKYASSSRRLSPLGTQEQRKAVSSAPAWIPLSIFPTGASRLEFQAALGPSLAQSSLLGSRAGRCTRKLHHSWPTRFLH